MGWIEGRKKHLQWSISFTKKALLSQFGLLVFNIAGIAWNVYWYRTSTTVNWGFGFGMGAFSSNTLWTLAYVAKFWGEIRDEKSELKYINEIELKEQLQDDRKMYKDAKESYEGMFAQYQEKLAELQRNHREKSHPTGQCNIDIQPASTQNCT